MYFLWAVLFFSFGQKTLKDDPYYEYGYEQSQSLITNFEFATNHKKIALQTKKMPLTLFLPLNINLEFQSFLSVIEK